MPGGIAWLTMPPRRHHPAGRSWFTDRPARGAGTEPPGRFVRRWRQRGFVDDPPNAALEVVGAPRGRDVMVLELSAPRRVGADGIGFRARRISGPSTPALARFARRADHRVARTFGGASLFVDPSSPNIVDVEFEVQGLPANGVLNIGFSGGPPPVVVGTTQIAAQQGSPERSSRPSSASRSPPSRRSR